jgi:hypothetical protein
MNWFNIVIHHSANECSDAVESHADAIHRVPTVRWMHSPYRYLKSNYDAACVGNADGWGERACVAALPSA